MSKILGRLMELLDLCHELFSANEECAQCQRTSDIPRHTVHFPRVPGSGVEKARESDGEKGLLRATCTVDRTQSQLGTEPHQGGTTQTLFDAIITVKAPMFAILWTLSEICLSSSNM
ncbi:hypothetical protein U0070_002472 [Myodes glareolus]|uniref:Uncharacterized protein n=1 Tax=Myodes glareolus TaxID=447135 RepID=A0AAW0HP70_MYOGA